MPLALCAVRCHLISFIASVAVFSFLVWFWPFYYNSLSATRLAFAAKAQLSQSKLEPCLGLRVSQSVTQLVSQPVSQCAWQVPGIHMFHMSSYSWTLAWSSESVWCCPHANIATGASGASASAFLACKIVMLDLSPEWTRDRGQAITIFIRYGQAGRRHVRCAWHFVMP